VAGRERKLSEVLKRGYSDVELSHIYELGRFHLENGELKKSEIIMNGIIAVAPEFVPAWQALTYIELSNRNLEQALNFAKQAYGLDPNQSLSGLMLVTTLLSLGDVATAGAYLGEVGEVIESTKGGDTNLLRFYKAQLARFRNFS